MDKWMLRISRSGHWMSLSYHVCLSHGGLPLETGRAVILDRSAAGCQLWRRKNGEQHRWQYRFLEKEPWLLCTKATIVVTSFGQEMKASAAGGGEYRLYRKFKDIWRLLCRLGYFFPHGKHGLRNKGLACTTVCCLKKMQHSLNQELFFIFQAGKP